MKQDTPESWHWLSFDQILPSQLYLNFAKLDAVQAKLYHDGEFQLDNLNPVPIKKRNGKIFFMDGHHTSFIVFQAGLTKMKVYWEPEEWNWELYDVCLQWCKDAGIRTIADLGSRKITNEQYQTLWIGRCQKMHKEIEERRLQEEKKKNSK